MLLGLTAGAAFGLLALWGGLAGILVCLLALAGAVWLTWGAEPVLETLPRPQPPAPPVSELKSELEPEPEPEPFTEPLEMIELPGGTFLMGSPDTDDQAYASEKPQHKVTLSAFAMGRYAVTRGLYRAVMPETPSEWQQDQDDDSLPANYVDWFAAVRFCNALSERQGLQPCYQIQGKEVTWDQSANGYRLPTEAEWEYATRAGTTTRWFCGDEATDLSRYAWFSENAGGRMHPVGEKEPNPWGFYDLAGNVYEWCWDWYGGYPPEPADNPTGPPSGAARVLRGGADWSGARLLRSACRYRRVPEVRDLFIGFRCVRAPCRQHGPSTH
jgi:formylglycine-generating enzyme required for sulfatase activity